MSYGMAAAFQSAVYQRLVGDVTIGDLVGGAVFDALPPGEIPSLYITLGPETVRDKSDKSSNGALHVFIVSVVTDGAGFAKAKVVAAAVSDALVDGELALDRGSVVGLWFDRATARRTGRAGRVRRIDLRFRARLEDN
ncbi:DUF3168 domain-containing protein [Rhodobacteraceae bacterium F11138]|nr:DUF3168 domain-containing protein [Rhodobacteraceae bacterium F11138]